MTKANPKENLYEQWSLEEVPYKDSDLAKKTFSYRFPVHIAARLAAIEDMFPNKTRSEVIIGILKLGLAQFQESLPINDHYRAPTDEEVHDMVQGGYSQKDARQARALSSQSGAKVDYIKKANTHFVQLEKERGNKAAKAVFKV